jgi:transposase
MKIDHGKQFVNGMVDITGIEEFWSFVKKRLMKYHGINPKKVPIDLKELEFRYNQCYHDLLMM